MMPKTFTIAGTSVLNGVLTFRFANGTVKNRAWILKHNGHTEVMLHELPRPMTKEKAVLFLKTNGIGMTAIVPGAKKDATPIIVFPFVDMSALPPELEAFIEDVVQAFAEEDRPFKEMFGPPGPPEPFELFGPPEAPPSSSLETVLGTAIELTSVAESKRRSRRRGKIDPWARPEFPKMLAD